ncbi:MAG: cysteine synthase family protein [Planctomycetota bacterium]|nr:cysteine synthase family protein [Planctomycetota bacterium]MDA1138033.1 cysteine synthase family protein [Planctomycetota bacterium]
MSSNEELAEKLARHPTLQLIGNTPLLELDFLKEDFPNASISAKIECFNPGGSIKDRPVRRMLIEAVRTGELTPEKTILDSSSGNAGIAYAMLGAILGFKVQMVVPGNASNERKMRLKAHGAEVLYTDPMLGYDEALRVVHQKDEEDPEKYFFADQYANENNWRAHYETTGQEILEQTNGKLTHFVAGVGTGGTITGVGKRLKEADPNIQIYCIRPERFPGVEGLKPLGEPGDIVPEILDETVIDGYIGVPIDHTADRAHLLAANGLFMGQSSGAFLHGACEVAKMFPEAKIVTVFPDFGERYFSMGLWD